MYVYNQESRFPLYILISTERKKICFCLVRENLTKVSESPVKFMNF